MLLKWVNLGQALGVNWSPLQAKPNWLTSAFRSSQTIQGGWGWETPAVVLDLSLKVTPPK